MKRSLFRLIIALSAGVALFGGAMLALSPPVSVASEFVPAPALAPQADEYTGTLAFDGDPLVVNEEMLEGEIWVSYIGPLKLSNTWVCDGSTCKYSGFPMWKFDAPVPAVSEMIVCVTGEPPWDYWSPCDTPLLKMRIDTCSNPNISQNCFGFGHFERYWNDEYGAYCYDILLNQPYPLRIYWDEWPKVCGAGGHTWNLFVAEVNGLPVTHPTTECIEIDSAWMTGPSSGTTHTPLTYEVGWQTSEPAEPEIVLMTDVAGAATYIEGDSGDNYQEYFVNWIETGVHTITAHLSTPCSEKFASVTTVLTASRTFTEVIPLLPIGDCNWNDPTSACYFDCDCPEPDYAWEIGGWITWEFCVIRCLAWTIWKSILWVALWMVNQFITAINIVLTYEGSPTADWFHWIEWQQFSWANFFTQTGENLGAFFQDHILSARDLVYNALTWLADEFEDGADLLGDNVEAFFTELAEWTHANLTEIGETLNESITNYGASRAADIENFRDWSYEGLLELADYFSSWGTGFGDFLALLVTTIANFLYFVLTEIAEFVRNFFDQLGNMAQAFVMWIDQVIYVNLIIIGKILNVIITGLGLFIATVIRLFRDVLYHWMTVLAIAVNAFFVGLGKFLALIVTGIAEFLKLLVLIFHLIMSALSWIANLLLDIITQAVEALVTAFEALIWITQLTLSLLAAFIAGLQSDTVPEMYTGSEGLYYFWRGLAFFETIAESSPLAALNTVAIGLIGINLLLWTAGQIADLISDILEFA